MPIYEYVCGECGKQFERWSTKIRDGEWTEFCTHCGGVGKRIISPTSFILKGGGWYKDGYEKNGGGSNNKVADSSSNSTETE